jgi:hypothetical protein
MAASTMSLPILVVNWSITGFIAAFQAASCSGVSLRISVLPESLIFWRSPSLKALADLLTSTVT